MDRSSRLWSLSNISGDAVIYRRFDASGGAGQMTPSQAVARVRDWLAWQPSVMTEVHDEVLARRSTDLRGSLEERRECLARGIEDAFIRGELVAFHVPLIFPIRKVERTPLNVLGPEAPVDEQVKQTWIEITVKDALGKAAPDLAYKLRTPDGKWKEGKTDGGGKIRLDDVHPGTCELEFPPPPPPA